jgi:hypothetical protein
MRKSYYIVLVILVTKPLLTKTPTRPVNVDQDALFKHSNVLEPKKYWELIKNIHGFHLRKQWSEDGNLMFQFIRWGSMAKTYAYKNGTLLEKDQTRDEPVPGHIPSDEYRSAPIQYGKKTSYNSNQQKSIEKCFVIFPKPKIEDFRKEMAARGEIGDYEYYKYPTAYPCGEEIEYNPDGSVKSRKRHPDKCLQGCGEFKPFMPPGKYKVRATSIVFRDKASTKGKSLGTIAKDTELQVIEDTHKIETHDFETAPWVKVKYSGKTGYIFGGFLDSLERSDL